MFHVLTFHFIALHCIAMQFSSMLRIKHPTTTDLLAPTISPILAVLNLPHFIPLGPVLSRGAVSKLEQMPKELFDLRNTEAMDGNGYVSAQLHQAFHHYIKVREYYVCTYVRLCLSVCANLTARILLRISECLYVCTCMTVCAFVCIYLYIHTYLLRAYVFTLLSVHRLE